MITVNGIVITEADILDEASRHAADPNPRLAAGHELVLRELVRQRAQDLDLPPDDDEAILEAVLAHDVRTPQADEASCRRYYERHPDEFREGDLVEVQHILFQVTAGVDVQRLRARGNLVLAELHRDGAAHFARYAAQYSNCPSGREGGDLGTLARGDAVPEFERAVFAMPADSLGRELIETRYGFHIVHTGRKVEGHSLAFEDVRGRLAAWLEDSSRRRAVHQYLRQLVGGARIEGIPMEGAESPLVQ